MKSGFSKVTLLVTVLNLVGCASSEPMRVRGTNPTAEPNVTVAQAVTPPPLAIVLAAKNPKNAVPSIEQTWEGQYAKYFRRSFPDRSVTAKDVADTLARISRETGTKPALLYVVPTAPQLGLVLITPGRQPIQKLVPEAKQEVLRQKAREFRVALTDPTLRNTTNYLPVAQQLYQWIIRPVEADLKAQGIDTLIFCMGAGIRTIPLAAFHDGKQFLIEKYSTTRIPAFKLTDTNYTDLRNSQVLAMGASEFKEQDPLPAVPVELSAIANDLWQGKSFLNQDFTLANLQSQLQQPFQIIHLATHADFKPGTPENSYVQLWDSKLNLDQMSRLSSKNPHIELLVLSACKTAIGSEEVELGFGGLAVESGVKSAVASLWYVSDEGSLALMTEFYRHLQTAPIKAEALRQAQIAMLKGQVRIENGQLQSRGVKIPLPSALAAIRNENLSHPYYWAAFTVIGSPW